VFGLRFVRDYDNVGAFPELHTEQIVAITPGGWVQVCFPVRVKMLIRISGGRKGD